MMRYGVAATLPASALSVLVRRVFLNLRAACSGRKYPCVRRSIGQAPLTVSNAGIFLA